MLGVIGALWGVGGVALLVSSAIVRMTPVAIDAFGHTLYWYHWVFGGAFLVFMLYSEGYRGFQLGFSPRVVARARYLRRHPRLVHVVFAPLFCMAFFHATKRRQRISLGVATAIVMAVVLVRLISQPWRGIIDLGVVAGLVWGMIALAVYCLVALGGGLSHAPDVPEGSASESSD